MKRLLVVAALGLAACGPEQGLGSNPPFNRDGGPDFSGMGMACAKPPADTDGDGISDEAEGAFETPPRDTDHDGIPDFLDSDSDGDGIPDAIEGRNGNPCTPPVDTDGDGKPDFQDVDSDSPTDSTVPDAEEAGLDPTKPVDSDGDGIPDYADIDNDGDGILDQFELTPQGSAVPVTTRAMAPDTDMDGIPDFLDTDSDGDTILDKDEGIVDTDGDFIPNYRDLDSDNDCIPDAIEAGDAIPSTPPVDTDGDGTPDFEDRDSDNEGLTDDKEDLNCNGIVDACETDRLKQDTDGDGVNDLIEYEDCAVKSPTVQMQTMCMCDGSNPSSSPLTHGDFVFVVDYMKPPDPMVETLDMSTDVSQADVVFALDSTGSMGSSLKNLAQGLANIVPQIQAKVKSIAFGVFDFRDFNRKTESVKSAYVVQYDHRIQTITTMAGLMSVQNALNALTANGGGDGPEAGWEALYEIAGGPPMTASYATGPAWTSVVNLGAVPPQPPTAGETQGTLGGAGFRSGSVPIVVTVTDAEWHDAPGVTVNGEDGKNDYDATNYPSMSGVPSRSQTVAALQNLNAHVVGLAALGTAQTGDPKARAKALAQDTGAVVDPADFGDAASRPAGCAAGQCCTGQNGAAEAPVAGQCPLAYTVDDNTGNGVSSSVVSGIVALANGLKFDIHVEASDVDPSTVDNFIAKLVPNLSGLGPAAVCITTTNAPLQDNFTGPKASPGADGTLDTFPGINGGKEICFDVVPKENTTVMNTDQPQFFRAQLQVKGVSGGSTVNLGTPRDVFFLVPPVIKNGPIN
jgi:hypothetical protein